MLIETNNYVDVATAAKMLGLTRATMSFHCKANRFPGQVKIGHFWIIPLEAIKNFERNKPGVKPKAKEHEQEQEELYPAFLDLDDDGDNDGFATQFDLTDPEEIRKREKLLSLIESQKSQSN